MMSSIRKKRRLTPVRGIGLAAAASVLGVTALISASPAPADENGGGCPDPSGRPTSNLVGAEVQVSSHTATYKFSSFGTQNPSGGVPGLIEYCVFPASHPDSATPVYPGWTDPGPPPPDPKFSFQRPDGNPSNIPLDGTTDITIGTADWTEDAPSGQVVLLHINDRDECVNRYPDDPKWDDPLESTCFVLPGTRTVTHQGTVSGEKYYDANANGKLDSGEAGIANWPINYDGPTTVNTQSGGIFSVTLGAGSYTFSEQVAGSPWMQTGNTPPTQTLTTGGASASLNTNKSYSVTIPSDADSTVTGLNFGNLCVGAGGGLTLGFWSNPNGQALVTPGDLGTLSGMNLRNANGSAFDPTAKSQLKSWLVSATSTNMAYMLSAQLAAMKLNVLHSFVSSTALIYAPGTNSANGAGFATVGAIIDEANTELGLHGLALSSAPTSAFRGYQEALKNALDQANNNKNFVQSGPNNCPTPFPV